MEKKVIIIDLDGTLLDYYGEVSKENREAIKKSRQKGAKVILASGRMPIALKNYAIELETDKYIICGNGAIVYDIEKDERIYENIMTKKKALSIIDICEKNSIYYSVYTESAIICKTLEYNVLAYNSDNAQKEENRKTNINIVENVYEYIDKINTQNILKINVCESNKIIFDGILKKIRKIPNINILEISNKVSKIVKTGTEAVEVEYFYAEISNKNVNKWTAIEELMKILKFKAEDVIAIGDNANDKKMIENAGLGIIMGNGALVGQTEKGEIVGDNDKNGVAEGLEKYYLK